MFDYLIDSDSNDYPPTVDAYDVAEDELQAYWEDQHAFLAAEKIDAKVFVIPADNVVYWANPNDIGNPKKWSKEYRVGMVKLKIPAIIVTDGDEEEDEVAKF